MWPKKETNPYLSNPLICDSAKGSQWILNMNGEVEQEEKKNKLKPVCIVGLIVMFLLVAGYCPYLRHLFGF